MRPEASEYAAAAPLVIDYGAGGAADQVYPKVFDGPSWQTRGYLSTN